MLPEKANIICLLKILKEYSDPNHPIPMREIIGKMENIWILKDKEDREEIEEFYILEY